MVSRSSKGTKLSSSDRSESSIQGMKPAPKRQKLDYGFHNISNADQDSIMVDAPLHPVYDPDKNQSLKGRKRFNADLSDIQEACNIGLSFDGLLLKRIRAGDDDGSVELVIVKQNLEHVLSANLLISDTSEYPKSHSLFCYSPDGDLSARLQRIVDEISEEPPKPLGRTVRDLVISIAQVVWTQLSKPKPQASGDTTDEDMEANSDGADDYDVFDEDDDIGVAPVEADSIKAKLQETFVDIVATDYRPGLISLIGNDFVISISLPVGSLAKLIPPRALMAWDRRILASSQHLTLLISGFHGVYPVLEPDGSYTTLAHRLGVNLSFQVGLSGRYKPGNDQVRELIRKHGLVTKDAEDEFQIQEEIAAQKLKMSRAMEAELEDEDETTAETSPVAVDEEPEEQVDPDRFDRFSLSSSLDSLMDQSFLKLVQIRRKFGLGWAGAELLHSESEKFQMKEVDVLNSRMKEISEADQQEKQLHNLPHDPLLTINANEPFNLPLTAFCYLLRRLSLCTRYCIVCHNRLQSDYEALKPYVCDSKLCTYQYYTFNRGPSLEYEIVQNPHTVDLLVSLAYVSAAEGVMEDPLPIGMGLRVPLPDGNVASLSTSFQAVPSFVPAEISQVLEPDADGLVYFDDLSQSQMRSCITGLLNTLPSIMVMKKHLEQKVKAGKRKPKLKDIDPQVLPAAWSILRWCVASCTAHIEAITSPEEIIKNLDPSWKQFRMTVGAPAAEAKFREAITAAQKESKNVVSYPVIYAFHGSPLKNWHSIIRHGLWYKTVSHGRAFGNGVYLAKDGMTSVGYYAQSGRSSWQKSVIAPANCMALAELVNLPSKFVSSEPHYVVKDTHWIMCRYLLVKGATDASALFTGPQLGSSADAETERPKKKKGKGALTPYVTLDPNHRTQMSGKVIEIPDPAFQLENLISAREADYVHEDPDEEDMSIFQLQSRQDSKLSQPDHADLDDEADYHMPTTRSVPKPVVALSRPKNDWKHDSEYVTKTLEKLMLPPFQSTPSASLAIQRELKAMIREQELAPNLKDLGWYMPPDLIGDNLYQWIVEVHSLDPLLPIAKDMKAKKLNSIIFEIRFPPTFPNSPPFFRIITPRFLPFIQGGGGHITGGGSICMDLLTSDGWLPSYSISAVLMQIRLAISNLEPRPARLAQNWNQPYDITESLIGYKRAAATHNWTVPAGLDHLVR